MGSVGFKEWALICEALGRGEQSVILRKGGIAEGREGFAFRSNEFFLFPTFFHEQVEKVRGNVGSVPAERAGEIEIRFFARLEFTEFVTDWETVLALEPFHIWQRDVVRERFEYDDAHGVHVGFLRVFRLEPAWVFANERRYGGCRSWVEVPELPDTIELHAVVTDKVHAERERLVKPTLLRGTARPPARALPARD